MKPKIVFLAMALLAGCSGDYSSSNDASAAAAANEAAKAANDAAIAAGAIDDSANDAASVAARAAEPTSVADRYPGPWKEDAKTEIVKALAQKSIRGCGEFKYRQSYDGSREYLVYCTRDGTNWKSYLVFPREFMDSDVMGPYQTDPSIAP